MSKVIQLKDYKEHKELIEDIHEAKEAILSRHDGDCKCPYCSGEADRILQEFLDRMYTEEGD